MTSEEVKPLRDYLQDKKQMIDIMFSCVEESHVRKMMPDVLKDIRMEEVKEECLVELLGMSRKRILTVLDGRELDESSDSLELSDISEDEMPVKSERQSQDKKSSKNTDKSKKVHGRRKSLESLSDSDSDSLSDRASPPKTNSNKRTTGKKSKVSKAVVKDKEEPVAKRSKERDKRKEEEEELAEVEVEGEGGGKNLLEILELEMRARAIRSLLQREETANKGTNSSDVGSKISTVIHEVQPTRHMDNDDENDVIIIDEGTDEIDLTRDDSDTEVVSVQKKTNIGTRNEFKSKNANDSVSSKVLNEKNSKVSVDNSAFSKGEVGDDTSKNTNEVSGVVSGKSDKKTDDRVVSKSDNKDSADDGDGSVSIVAEDKPSKTDIDLSSKDLQDRGSTEVVDGKKNSSNEASSSAECSDAGNAAPRNWTERWLDNSDVKRVMKTSRVLTNLKKRLITNSKQKTTPQPTAETQPVVDQQPVTVEGTVSEFLNLQKKVVSPEDEQKVEDTAETVLDDHLSSVTEKDNTDESAIESLECNASV